MNRHVVVELLENRRLLSAIGFGGAGADAAYDVASDRDGNTYIVGNFQGTVDFDPGPGVATLSGGGTFIVRINRDGRFGWARRLATKSVPKIAADRGSVFAVGTFSGTVDFDPNATVHKLTSFGGTDAFLLHLTGTGDFDYVKQFGGKGNDEGTAVACDIWGQLAVGGQFNGKANFNPDGGGFFIKSGGGADGFIVYLNALGGFTRAGSFGGPRYDSVRDLAIDSQGNVLATGSYIGTVDFDPDSRVTHNNTALTADAYVLKWSSRRAFAWVGGLGGAGVDYGTGIAADRDGNVYSTGNFQGTGDFDPAANGTHNVVGDDAGSVYISKLNADGTFGHAKALPGFKAASIAVDKAKNSYAVGSFAGTGVYVTKSDPNGNATTFSKVLPGQAGGVVLSHSGNVLVAGWFAGTEDFDPGAGTSLITSNGDFDGYLVELDASGNAT